MMALITGIKSLIHKCYVKIDWGLREGQREEAVWKNLNVWEEWEEDQEREIVREWMRDSQRKRGREYEGER